MCLLRTVAPPEDYHAAVNSELKAATATETNPLQLTIKLPSARLGDMRLKKLISGLTDRVFRPVLTITAVPATASTPSTPPTPTTPTTPRTPSGAAAAVGSGGVDSDSDFDTTPIVVGAPATNKRKAADWVDITEPVPIFDPSAPTQFPLVLSKVTVNSLGTIDTRPNFHDRYFIWYVDLPMRDA